MLVFMDVCCSIYILLQGFYVGKFLRDKDVRDMSGEQEFLFYFRIIQWH